MAYENNPYISQASKMAQSRLGSNVTNRFRTYGSQGIARTQEAGIQAGFENLRSNPGLLMEFLSGIQDRAGMAHSDLGARAEQIQLSADQGEVERLTNLGMRSEELDILERQRKRQERMELISAIIGGGLTVAGGLGGAAISSAGRVAAAKISAGSEGGG